MSTVIEEPTLLPVTESERAEYERQTALVVVRVRDVVVTDPLSYQAAAEWLRDVVRPLKKNWQNLYDPRIKQASDLHRGLIDDRKRFVDPLTTVETLVADALKAYDARVEQERLAADALEREERERLQRQSEEAAVLTNAMLTKIAEDDLVERAAAAESAGDTQQAARILATPIVMPQVAPAPVFRAPLVSTVPAPPKVQGVSTSSTWKAEITDKRALVAAWLAGRLPAHIAEDLIEINMTKLNQLARAQRQSFQVPGVKAVEVKNIAVSSRR